MRYDMEITTAEKTYLNELIQHCSNFRLDGLPAMGEMFYQEISLEDIFAPLHLLPSKDSDAIIELNASIWDSVNDNNGIQTKGEVDDATIAKIDTLFPAGDIPTDVSETSFSQLVSFIDVQLAKPRPSTKQELDSFIAQLDSQIELLSQKESIPNLNKLTVKTNPIQLIEEKYQLEFKLNSNAKSKLSPEKIQLLREYDNRPVGPIITDYPSRKVILSVPGCGKTTLAKRIALAYASGDDTFKKSYHLPGDLFPVLLYCRSLDESDLNQMTNFPSIAYTMAIKNIGKFNIDQSSFIEIIDSHAQSGDLIIILDGFDELLQKKQREILVVALYKYLMDNNNVHLILTSRIATFSGQDQSENEIINIINSIPHIKRNIIPALNRQEVDDFVQRWHNVLFPFNVEKVSIAKRIIEQLHTPAFKYLEKITCIPLHLSNILLITRSRNCIPNNKIELYDEYIRLSLNWHATGNIETSDMQTQLAYIAYHMMKKGQQRISKKALCDVLIQCSYDLDGEFLVPIDETNVYEFIKELEERTCILEKSSSIDGMDIYEFTHLFLQEYLAAYAITRGCAEDSDIHSTLDIVSSKYQKSKWREVVILSILLTYSKSERNSIIDFLIKEAKNNEDNYHAINLLFELIANGVSFRTERKHAIYDLLFKDHITDYQIRKICEFMQDTRSEEFKAYVMEKFNESLASGDSNYAFALATINAFEYLRDSKMPLEEAEKLVLNYNDSNLVIGLYIFTVLGWCKYCKIKSEFSMSNIMLSVQFKQRIYDLIISRSEYLNDIATALKHIALAEYMMDFSFLDKLIYCQMIDMLRTAKETIIAEEILTVFPLDFRTLSFHKSENIDDLKSNYLKKYYDHLSDEKSTDELIFDFSICSLLGCWNVATDELLNQFTDLEGIYSIKRKQLDDASATKLNIVRRDIYKMSEPVSTGLNYYREGDFESAKAAFLVAFGRGNTTACNNLGYMLRRGEIQDVTIQGNAMSVEQLLSNGISSGEPFSIINYALYIANIGDGFDYSKGLNIVQVIKDTSFEIIQNIYFWWFEVAKKGEIEGIIVLAWLMELGCISEHTSLGTLNELKKRIDEHFL